MSPRTPLILTVLILLSGSPAIGQDGPLVIDPNGGRLSGGDEKAPDAANDATAAREPSPLSSTLVLEQPRWVRRPSGADVAKVYPLTAQRQRKGGEVVIGCTIDATGRMKDCTVLDEKPKGAGFGAAGLALAPHFQMSATRSSGEPTEGGFVRIPLRFSIK